MNELKVRVHNIYLPMIGLSAKALEMASCKSTKEQKTKGKQREGGEAACLLEQKSNRENRGGIFKLLRSPESIPWNLFRAPMAM